MPSAYAVTNTNYSGAGSLSAAIISADAANDSQAVIVFSGIADNATIQLNSTTLSPNGNFGPTGFVVSGTGTSITIEGGTAPGLTIDGGNAVRLFAVASGDSLTVSNITLSDGLAQGGNGGNGQSGGGGGAGLGGAVFVQSGGTLTVQSSTITGNVAQGGTGGSGTDTGYIGGGGGGGMGGNGGNYQGRFGGTGGGPNGAALGPAYNYPIPGGYGGGGSGGGAAWGGAQGGFGGGGGGEGSANGWSNYGGGGFGGGSGGCNAAYENANGGQAGAGGFGGGAGAGIGSGLNGYGGGGGGGMGGAVFSNGTVIITNSTLTNNSAIGGAAGPNAQAGEGFGGAVFERNGNLTLLNSTISGNTAAQGGRGVYLMGDGATGSANATITNTIVGQSDTSVTDFVAATINGGSVASSGTANIIGTAVNFGGTSISVDPMLGSLANNGGPTLTLALQSGSPAIGGGVAATTVGGAGFGPSASSITVNGANGITPDSIIKIDGEVMLVTSVNGSTMNVVRGYNSTTAVTASAGDAVYLYLDQAGNTIAGTPPDIGALQFAGIPPVGAPTVTSVAPDTGSLYGGTTVTITGTNLQNATMVNFGIFPGKIVSDSGTTIVAITQRSDPGTYDTTVTTVGWDTSAPNPPADQFTFTGTLPTYSEFLDASGNLTISMATPSVNADLSFGLSGGNYTFTDSNGFLFDVLTGAGADSTSITGFGTSSVAIPSSAVNSITVNLGTGTNVFTITSSDAPAAPLTVNPGTASGDQIAITGNFSDGGAVTLNSNSITSTLASTLTVGSLTLNDTSTATLQGTIVSTGSGVVLVGAGNTTISGNINLGATGNLTDAASGPVAISGVISGTAASSPNTSPGLIGTYFQVGNGANQQVYIQPAAPSNPSWIGNQTPAATALLIGSIDFPNISGSGFEDNNNNTYYNFGNNNNSVEARWYGDITIPNNGISGNPISFQTGSDDGSMLYIDGSPVVSNNNYQGVTYNQGTLDLTPGVHTIDIEYYNGGGGAAMFARWDPTGGSNFVDIPNSVFTTNGAPVNGLVQTGTGTLTVSGHNTYVGPSNIITSTVVLAAGGTLGANNAAGINVNAGAALQFTGGLNYTTAEPVAISGSGSLPLVIPTAYAGFTGATGGLNSVQNILNWTYTSGATNIDYSAGFTGSGLDLNNGASYNGSQLELTDGFNNEARTAWTPTPVPAGSFTTTFQWTYAGTAGSPADGFTFALQNQGNDAVGAGGGGLAYNGISGTSLAVEFNQYNGSGTGSGSDFGIGLNGAINHGINLVPSGINFSANPNDIYQATITDDGQGQLTVTISDTNTGATYTQSFTINDPAGGNGAIENISGDNTFAAPITVNGSATIGADAGNLSLTGPTLNMSASNGVLTTTGAGNIAITSTISGVMSTGGFDGIVGDYFNLPAAQNLIQPAAPSNSTWLGNQTPAATAPLLGPLDFYYADGNWIQNNGFADNLGNTYYNLGAGNNNNVEGRWSGEIMIPGSGTNPVPINFATTSDDGSMLYIDGSPVVNNNFFQGPVQQTGLVDLTPGLHAIDIEYYNGGGGAAMEAQWDPTGGTTFVDIPNFATSGGRLIKNGTGTTTLSGTNTYTGTTLVNDGTLQVDGSIATSYAVTVASGATLSGTGTVPATTVNGTLEPGDPGQAGTLNTDLAFGTGSTLQINENNSICSAVNVTGTASLTGATLSLSFADVVTVGSTYTIVHTTGGLDGTTFNGLPDGSTLNDSSGQTFQVNYTATDVILTKEPSTGTPPTITGVIINQDISALYNAAGQPFAGAQRSMVNDIVYTFSEPVNIVSSGTDPNVFTITVAAGWTGTVPTLNWSPVTGSGNTQWAVSFSGGSVSGGSIANGAYDITVNVPSEITAVSDSQALTVTPGIAPGTGNPGYATQEFYRLYGDINGDHFVNAADNSKFKLALATYNQAFDYNGDGFVNAFDNGKFKNELTVNFSGFTPTI